jgi:hypothetical protein
MDVEMVIDRSVAIHPKPNVIDIFLTNNDDNNIINQYVLVTFAAYPRRPSGLTISSLRLPAMCCAVSAATISPHPHHRLIHNNNNNNNNHHTTHPLPQTAQRRGQIPSQVFSLH